MFGILNVNKPPGATSRDVVNRVQRLVRPVKVGHAGTLDPLATGVLAVCLGPATRLIEYVQRMPKRYLATFLLGRQSDTEDVTGKVIELPEARQPTREELQSVLSNFIGDIQQQPPAFSALKVGGRRAYKLARSGEQPNLAPRRIHIHQIELVEYEYPQFVLNVSCGSGTYIRALGRDVGLAVGSAAVMSDLVRTAIGNFQLTDACDPAELTAETISNFLQSPTLAVGALPQVTLDEDELHRIYNGLPIPNRFDVRAGEIAVLDKSGTVRAIAAATADELRPAKCFAPAE